MAFSSHICCSRSRGIEYHKMSHIVIIVLASWLAGFAAFMGGMLARIEGTAETTAKREIVHGVVAFGGGILVAAVAFALVPEGMAALTPVTLATTFLVGGLAFCFLDAQLSKQGGTKAQFMAMLMDFLPEAISLGAVFGHNCGGRGQTSQGADGFACNQCAWSDCGMHRVSLLTGTGKVECRHHEFRRRRHSVSHLSGHCPEIKDAPTLDASAWCCFRFYRWDDRKTGHRMKQVKEGVSP
jgi:hypothetical protein